MNKFWAGKCFRRVLFTCGSLAEDRDVVEQLLLLKLLTGTARCHEFREYCRLNTEIFLDNS